MAGGTKLLILTVGGSADPLVSALREYGPDYTYFVCSGDSKGRPGSEVMVDGPGEPCGPGKKAIVFQLGLAPNVYEKIVLDNPDDLNEIWTRLEEVDRKAAAEFTSAQRWTNYTGGTKTMSVGAVLFSLERGWNLAFMEGPRRDLVRVTGGENWIAVNTGKVKGGLLIGDCWDFLTGHDYAAAGDLLKPILNDASVTLDFKDKILMLRNLCRAFESWDRFDHAQSLEMLERYKGGQIGCWKVEAKKIMGLINAGPYFMVCDLLRNADRRALHKNFDDAVARLYRAVELLSQTVLREKGMETSDLKVESLPVDLREKYSAMKNEKGKIQLPLVRGYELLVDLVDPLGIELYQPNRDRLLNAIEIRNNSILAHGLAPVGEDGYEKSGRVMRDFVVSGLEMVARGVAVSQLPGEEIIGWCGF